MNYELLHAIADMSLHDGMLTLIKGTTAYPEVTVQDFSDDTHLNFPPSSVSAPTLLHVMPPTSSMLLPTRYDYSTGLR